MFQTLRDIGLVLSIVTNVFLIGYIARHKCTTPGSTPPDAGARPTGPSGPISGGDLTRVRDVLRSEGKIPAIKLYRQLTGAGLADAKHAVDAMELE